MGLFRRIFGGERREGLREQPREAVNRVSGLADRLQREGRIEDLEEELARFDPEHLEGTERESWHHLWGIEAFRHGKLREALVRFEAAHRACPESAVILFSLGQAHENVGEPDKAFEMFDRCRFPAVPSAYALTQVRYAYLWDRYEEAFSYLEPVLKAHYDLGVADDHFLYIRGMPFFGRTWSCYGALCELTDDLPRLRSATEEASSRLRDYDFNALLRFVGCVESGDFSRLVEEWEESAARMRESGWPAGYAAMRAAVVKALHTKPEESESALDAVELGEKDHRWLEDVRLLARCAIAGRVGDAERETALQGAFLARQPYLFEPDHAFDFRLTGYQERLKPAYREYRNDLASAPPPPHEG